MKKLTFLLMAAGICMSVQAKDYVLDVRTPAEIAQTGKVPGALVADFRDPSFKRVIEGYRFDPKKDTVAVYCRSGRRAEMAIQVLKGYGFPDKSLTNLGGYHDAVKALKSQSAR